MKEIEYKFLINRLPKQIFDQKTKRIEITQHYFQKNEIISYLKKLNLSNEQIKKIESVRVRIETFENKNRYVLNAKSAGNLVRDEYEMEISKKDFDNLLKYKMIGTINKTRYKIKHQNFVFEFDEYHDYLEGLKTCEIEVENVKKYYFEIIRALTEYFKLEIKDITNDQKYKNMNLSKEMIYENNW